MEIGLGVLGLSPPVFWMMTPAELQAALRGRLGPGAATSNTMTADELGKLMRRYPDQKGP
jgi:uncharacterized phage protein (TIGR02216 family)